MRSEFFNQNLHVNDWTEVMINQHAHIECKDVIHLTHVSQCILGVHGQEDHHYSTNKS